MEVFLSVIVPVYKVEPYLKECVDSILNQTFKDLEVILVDDGSPDGCPVICDTYAQRDRRVQVIHKENGGLVSARKAGGRAAQGRYITFVDSDDWIETDMYAVMAGVQKESGADIIVTDYFFDRQGKCIRYENKVEEGIYEGDRLGELQGKMIYSGAFYYPGVYPSVWNKWYKRELLLPNLLPIDERITWGEDMACTYPCFLDAKSILVYREKCFYHYRYRPEAMTKGYDVMYFRKFSLLYEYLDKCLREKGGKKLTEQLNYHRAFTTVFGITGEVGKVPDILAGMSGRRIREGYKNPDITGNMKGVIPGKMKIPFPYRQILQAFAKKQTCRLYFLTQMMRIWKRFFWK